MIDVEVANEQTALAVDESRLRQAMLAILRDAGVEAGEISLAIVDDATIRELNRRYLNHDDATDVLSFVLGRKDASLDAEIIVSADTAVASAPRFRWPAQDELLLYVIHGALHLVGYDDTTSAAAGRMRDRERHYLTRFGLNPRYDEAPTAETRRTPAVSSKAAARGSNP